MSQANLEIARRFVDRLVAGDYEGASSQLDRDCVWVNTRAFPGARSATGREAIVDFWRGIGGSFDLAGGTDVEDMRAIQGLVVVGLRTHGRGASSRVPLDVRWALTLSIGAGKSIERAEVRGDYATAVEAAGADE